MKGNWDTIFLGKKTSSDMRDLAPEVCQRRLVLKRLQQASDKKMKPCYHRQNTNFALCVLVYSALTCTVWTHALTYNVQAGTYKNFYIYRNWRVVLFGFPLDNTKTDEQNLSCFFFFPANQGHTF